MLNRRNFLKTGLTAGAIPFTSALSSFDTEGDLLLSDTKVKSVELLKAEKSISFKVHEDVLQFTVPSLEDYEIAAITIG